MKNSLVAVAALLSSILLFLLIGWLSSRMGTQVNLQVLVLARTGIGCLTAFAAALVLKAKLPPPFSWQLARRSLWGIVGIQATFFALMNLPLSTSIAIIHTSPAWTAVLGCFFLGHRLSIVVWSGVLATILGAFLIQMPMHLASALGVAAAVTSAIIQSIVLLETHRMSGLHPLKIIIHSSGTCAIASLAILLVFGLD